MRKKLLLVISLFGMISLLIPLSSVMAADTDVLRGVSFTSQNNKVAGIDKITDGDISTFATWSDTDTLTYIFPESVDIDYGSLVIKTAIATVDIYNTKNELLYNMHSSSSTRPIADLQDVKKITIYGSVYSGNSSTSGKTQVSDLRLMIYDLNPDIDLFVINQLEMNSISNDSVTLNWNTVDSEYFKHFKVYQGSTYLGNVTNNSYSISGLVPGQDYSFKITAVDVNDKEYTNTGKTIYYSVPLPDEEAPDIPTNVEVTPDRYSSLVTWTHSKASDLSGYYIYLNGNRVNSSPILTNSYQLTGLNHSTDYEIQIVSVDASGNVSEKTEPFQFRTLEVITVPDIPTSVTAQPYNSSVLLSWLPQTSAKTYKIYVDGVFKLETNQTSVKLSNLENGKNYNFTVSAVNDIGESEQSSPVSAEPSVNLLPDVSLGYSLKDVTTGVVSWFSSVWLLLAFSIAIPLSFYIGNRVKGLFQ